MKVLVVITVCQVLSHGSQIPDGRIVGGQPVDILKVPYQVALVFRRDGSFFCGGSIISDEWVLTAAHCAVNRIAANTDIRVGSNYSNRSGTVIQVDKIVVHPTYRNTTFDFDYALVKLKNKIKFDRTKALIKLPKSGDAVETGTPSLVSGYGLIENGKYDKRNRLFQAKVFTQDLAECKKSYGSLFTSRMLCAGDIETGACNGDSGGPLVRIKDNLLIGVVSFGRKCGDIKSPTAFARVSAVRNWINSTSGV